MEESSPITANRLERVLAYMVAGVIGVSVLCMVASLIAMWSGVFSGDGGVSGIWPYVTLFPSFGLPVGMLLLIVLLIVSIIRRRRGDQQKP